MVTADAINEMLEAAWTGSGCTCLDVTATTALATMVPDRSMIRPGGFIAGPALFGIADAALWFLVFGAVDRIEPMALTSELSIRFLRPAAGGQLYARAVLNSAGSRRIVGSVTVWTDGNEQRPNAAAQGTYVLPISS